MITQQVVDIVTRARKSGDNEASKDGAFTVPSLIAAIYLRTMPNDQIIEHLSKSCNGDECYRIVSSSVALTQKHQQHTKQVFTLRMLLASPSAPLHFLDNNQQQQDEPPFVFTARGTLSFSGEHQSTSPIAQIFRNVDRSVNRRWKQQHQQQQQQPQQIDNQQDSSFTNIVAAFLILPEQTSSSSPSTLFLDSTLIEVIYALLRQAFGPTSDSTTRCVNVLHARHLADLRRNERCHAAPLRFSKHDDQERQRNNQVDIAGGTTTALRSIPTATNTQLPEHLQLFSDDQQQHQHRVRQRAETDATLLPVRREELASLMKGDNINDDQPSSWIFQFDNKFLLCGRNDVFQPHQKQQRQQQNRDENDGYLNRPGRFCESAGLHRSTARYLNINNNSQQSQQRSTTNQAIIDNSTSSRIFIMDQHAVSERGRLEHFWRRGLDRCLVERFRLADPIVITFNNNNRLLLLLAIQFRHVLSHWGWDIEQEQQEKQTANVSAAAVTAATAMTTKAKAVKITTCPKFRLETFELLATGIEPVAEYLHLLHSNRAAAGAPASSFPPPPLLQRFAVIRSCRGAVMFNDVLDREQMRDIVQDAVGSAQLFDRCSHGRVAMKALDVSAAGASTSSKVLDGTQYRFF